MQSKLPQPFYLLKLKPQIWEGSFREKSKFQKQVKKIEKSTFPRAITIRLKKLGVVFMQLNFPQRLLSVEPNISESGGWFSRKGKNSTIWVKNPPTHFFDDCRKWGKVKRD